MISNPDFGFILTVSQSKLCLGNFSEFAHREVR
jgi:hypothetical protein